MFRIETAPETSFVDFLAALRNVWQNAKTNSNAQIQVSREANSGVIKADLHRSTPLTIQSLHLKYVQLVQICLLIVI